MLIFVYGTLKRGLYNHDLLIRAKFLGEAVSKYRYPMVNIQGDYPYLINDKNHGMYIKGELFEVEKVTEELLDILEEYPNLYTKEPIEVMVDGKDFVATAYFVRKKIDYSHLKLLEEF